MEGHADDLTSIPWIFDFACKARREGLHEGEHGLILEGYASLFNHKDQQGETPRPGMFSNLDREWGAPKNRQILFHHGWDPILRRHVIGRAIDYRVDAKGLHVTVFIPERPRDGWKPEVKARFQQVYDGIKRGLIRGFSVAGMFLKRGNDLLRLAMDDLSVTPAPVEARATFTVGEKAVKAMMASQLTPYGYAEDTPEEALGAGRPPRDQTDLGVLSRQNWTKAMDLANQDGARHLHDHLLDAVPAHLQGEHKAESCGICADRRMTMGVKAALWPGEKADLNAAARNALDDADFAYIDKDGNRHLPIHDAAHVRAALARFNQTQFESASAKQAARRKINAAAKRFGIDVSDDDNAVTAEAGKKAALLAQVERVAARHEAELDRLLLGAKAGATFSAASKAAIRTHVAALRKLADSHAALIGEGPDRDDGAGDGDGE